MPGPVRKDGTVNRCVNLGWGVVPVAEVLSGLLDGVPVGKILVVWGESVATPTEPEEPNWLERILGGKK